eukprot:m.47342 g.47342  ORF g.47342 m.47342 type:complete len:228 (-) comp6877_c0_seq1:222-905(-)
MMRASWHGATAVGIAHSVRATPPAKATHDSVGMGSRVLAATAGHVMAVVLVATHLYLSHPCSVYDTEGVTWGPWHWCQPRQHCDAGYVETVSNTTKGRMRCVPCAQCHADGPVPQFEAQACTRTTQTVCQSVSTCASTEFEAAKPTPTTDRECTSCRQCPLGHVVSAPCTSTTDATCTEVLSVVPTLFTQDGHDTGCRWYDIVVAEKTADHAAICEPLWVPWLWWFL